MSLIQVRLATEIMTPTEKLREHLPELTKEVAKTIEKFCEKNDLKDVQQEIHYTGMDMKELKESYKRMYELIK